MARVMEIIIIVNGVCGIAAFLLARGAIRRIKRGFGLEDEPKNLEDPGRKEVGP